MNQLKKLSTYSLVCLVDKESQTVLFEETVHPHSKLAMYVFSNKDTLKNKKLELYANQVGLVIATLTTLIPFEHVFSKIMSKPAEKICIEKKIPYTVTDKTIDLIYSSKNPEKICSLEALLVDLSSDEAMRYLSGKYNNND